MNASNQVRELLWAIAPELPSVGEETRVFIGVRKKPDGYRNTTVRGPDDAPRKCVVLGYTIELAGACGFYPRNENSVGILAVVKLKTKLPTRDRVLTVHIDCLEPVTCET